MKKLITILPLVMVLNLFSRDFFVSNTGNDANAGTSTAVPWRTLAKVNGFALIGGDHVFLESGSTWNEVLIPKSGTPGNPVTYTKYGAGANPIITGLKNVSGWTNLASNIWESNSAVSTLSTCNIVLINGVNYAMGRYPNTGYLTYQSAVGSTSITSSSLNSSITNWTGAEVVIRKVAWVTDRNVITSHSGSALTYTVGSSPAYNGNPGWGFFIEDDPKTLDTLNEWYYSPSTKKIQIYSSGAPTNVQISTIDTLVKLQGKNNVTFDGIDFTGANKYAFTISAQNITIQNCNINFTGQDAIWGGQNISTSTGFIFRNNAINHTNGNAILLRSFFTGALVQNNTIKNTGVQPGMINRLFNPNSNGIAIQLRADNQIAEYNTIDSSGFIGIGHWANNTITRFNFINNSLLDLADGGAIYCFVGDSGPATVRFTGNKVLSNIILNTYGNNDGTLYSDLPQGQGIYMDDLVASDEIAGNSVANGRGSGLFLHNDSLINIHDNTFYNNGRGTQWSSDNASHLIRQITLKNNLFVSKTNTQDIAWFRSLTGKPEILAFGSGSTIDSNYYARPIDDNTTIAVKEGSSFLPSKTLAQWQTYSGFDAHSHKSPRAITSTDSLTFIYNATNAPAVTTLPYNYEDMYGIQYNGSITLAPYTSAVLITNGPITGVAPPSVNAGTDQAIVVSSTTLSAVATPAGGHSITTYTWSMVSGPSSAIFSSASAASTGVSGLVSGIYVFHILVTQDDAQTASDNVQVAVSIPDIPPTVSAGPDQTITLPTNSTTASGSASDPDGFIVAYAWRQISGPAASILSPSSPSTTLAGMNTAGTYGFELAAHDNMDAVSRDTMQVFVNSPSNISPVADAGPDQSTNATSITLIGSGTDADGTVVAYLWTKISGPAGGTITSPSSATTTVTGLSVGTYFFRLQITDNLGATGTDNVRVIIVANIAPVAHAGVDQVVAPGSVALAGSGTDVDGTIVNYAWTIISGPGGQTITSPSSASTTVTGLIVGVYRFRLVVTDNNGATGSDTVQVTVTASNVPPVANAGADQAISLPTTTATLDAWASSDADGTITTYAWSQISGPSTTITSPGSAITGVTGLTVGTLVYRVIVTDNNGATSSDNISIVVSDASSHVPSDIWIFRKNKYFREVQ